MPGPKPITSTTRIVALVVAAAAAAALAALPAAAAASSAALLPPTEVPPALASDEARLPLAATGTPTELPEALMLLALSTVCAAMKMLPADAALRGPRPSGSEVSVWMPLPAALAGIVYR